MPKWFSVREKEWINERLLESGGRMFAAYGLKKTSIEELTRASGISKGAFYRFYESKEALFLAVVEQVEGRVRGQILDAVALPGPSPRTRLFVILKSAFALFRELPILRVFGGDDFDALMRALPPVTLQQHISTDRAFLSQLLARCREAGIPIQVTEDQIITCLYPLVQVMLHAGDLAPEGLPGSLDLHLELAAAYMLGEIDLVCQPATAGADAPEGGGR